MAPELVRGQRDISGQVDLYALGCLLFEMLTGRTPYLGDNFAQLFEQHLHAPPPRVRDFEVSCPPQLEALIVQLLAKSPEDRPFNARSVQGLLGEMCQDALPGLPADDGPDRAALNVRPIQRSLSERIRRSQAPRDVSWPAFAILSLAVLVLIVALAFLGR
jgi:serine/threonine protein kinase